MLPSSDVDTHEALLALAEDTCVTVILAEFQLKVRHDSGLWSLRMLISLVLTMLTQSCLHDLQHKTLGQYSLSLTGLGGLQVLCVHSSQVSRLVCAAVLSIEQGRAGRYTVHTTGHPPPTSGLHHPAPARGHW